VVALALSSGPVPGLVTGFFAGLALDVAPPANHLIGSYALVFCLVGYGCGLIAADLENSVLLPLAASAVGAAAGAALYAVVGVFLGNLDVTGAAVRHVLPLTVLYDVLLSPFVLYGVALASKLAARLTGAAQSQQPAAGPLAVPGTPPVLPGGRTPRIRAAAARQRDGWIGGGGWLAASAELARTRPATIRLHLSGRSRAHVRPGPARPPAAGQTAAKLHFRSSRRGDNLVGSRLLGGGGWWGALPGGVSPGPPSPKMFSRRRTAASLATRFSGRAAWGFRGAGSLGGGATPRRGTFSSSAPHRAPAASPAAPRRGTFTGASSRKRAPAPLAPRRGTFSGSRGRSGGAGQQHRTGFGAGPRRFRALRRNGSGRTNALGRVRGGRTISKRNGGWR